MGRLFLVPSIDDQFSSAGLAAALGDPERALRLAGAAETLRKETNSSLSSSEEERLKRRLAPAEQVLSQEHAAAARAEG